MKTTISTKHRTRPLIATAFALLVTAAIALVLPARAGAKDVKIDWQQTGAAVGSGYLPRVASDGGNATDGSVNTASIYQDATGFAEFGFQTGFFDGGSTVGWNSAKNIKAEVGHEASIAMTSCCIDSECDQSGDAAIEVHQGGQDKGSLLWYRIGQGNVTNVAESVGAGLGRHRRRLRSRTQSSVGDQEVATEPAGAIPIAVQ